MCVDKSPCCGGLACKESQSTEQNCADCLEGSSKAKQTQALILSLRVWILLKTLKLPEKDDSKLLYWGVEMGFCQCAEGRAAWGSLRQDGGLAASTVKFSKSQCRARQPEHKSPGAIQGACTGVCISISIHIQTLQGCGRWSCCWGKRIIENVSLGQETDTLKMLRMRQYILPSPSSESKLVCSQFRKQMQTQKWAVVTSDS